MKKTRRTAKTKAAPRVVTPKVPEEQITHAPVCPNCGESDSATCRSKGIEIMHEGERCRAARQYRKCRHCGHNFPVTHIKGNAARKARKRSKI